MVTTYLEGYIFKKKLIEDNNLHCNMYKYIHAVVYSVINLLNNAYTSTVHTYRLSLSAQTKKPP